MNPFKAVGVLFTCALLAIGCAQLGVPAPQNTEQGIAYIYPAITATAQETTVLLKEGKIKKAEAQTVLSILENTRAAANIARDYVKAGDESRAAASLTLARSVLSEAQAFIQRWKGN